MGLALTVSPDKELKKEYDNVSRFSSEKKCIEPWVRSKQARRRTLKKDPW